MQSYRARALWAALFLPTVLLGQDVATSGVISVGGGTSFQTGDRAAFQAVTQQTKRDFGGIEEFKLTREGKDDVFKFEARLLPGLHDYRLALDYTKAERYYLKAGFSQYRVWSDGSAGYFQPKELGFALFDEELAIDRSKLWLEVGVYTANQTLIKLRYDRSTRNGTKDTTHWGDTNLVGSPYGTRNIVPGFYDIDEVTDTVAIDVGNQAAEHQKWNVGARYSETSLDNKRYNRRRPGESADRTITTKDETKNDLFAAHGFYLRTISEELTISGGALITDLDTHIAGSRIYGQSYDPVYDPAYLRRQQRDEGFYALEGSSNLKQTILNLNAVYTPRKHLSIRPSLRFENLRQDTVADFVETNIGASPSFTAILEDVEGDHNKDWDELIGAVDVRYTGIANWTFSGEAEFVSGSGSLEEERTIHHTGQKTIDRDIENERESQKYSLNANWYAKPGLTFAAQYYFKVRVNDYDAIRDNTPAGTADRYPAYITDQDFETHDFNLRMSWKPVPLLNLVSRYDYQQSTINSIEAGLGQVESSEVATHIFSQSVTWSPTGRLYLTGSANATFDQTKTPAYPIIQHGDNNYVNFTLGGGYVVSAKDDIFIDYNYYDASNFIDNAKTSLAYGADQTQQAAYVTWKRRQSEHLVYTVKYGYITNRDGTYYGQGDFDAHVIYAKAQYHF